MVTYLRRGGWLQATSAAAVAFMALLCVGALGVTAIKLQDPSFGSGSGPVATLTAVVLAGLGSLGTGLRIDDLFLFAFPLGGLALSGWAIASISALSTRASGTPGRARVVQGAKIGIPLAIICAAAAAIFRFGGQTPVRAGVGETILAALLWGALFGALGGAKGERSFKAFRSDVRQRIASLAATLGDAISTAGAMVMTSLVLGLTTALVWLIVVLIGGSTPRGFDAGDAGAAGIFLLAFAPNVVSAIVAASMGATIEIGARVSVQGELVGPLREISLFDWAGLDTPWFVFLLLLIPVTATTWGGFLLFRKASSRPLKTIAVAATMFALTFGALAVVGEARLGAGLVSSRGFGRVAPHPFEVLLFAWAWGFAGGLAGWRIAAFADSPSPRSADEGEASQDEQEETTTTTEAP